MDCAIRKPYRIVVVDDDPRILSLLQTFLERRGYQTLAASSGPTALHAIESRHLDVDLLICDFVMPGMRGPELAERLQTLCPDAHVLLMSAYDEALLAEARHWSFLSKPFNPSELVAKVGEILEPSDLCSGSETAA